MSRRAERQFRVAIGGRSLLIAAPAGVHGVDPYAHRFARAMEVDRGDAVLDLGCGAGTYALAALARGAERVVATDVDPRAVEATARNAARNGLSGVEGRVGSLFQPVRGERFDVVVATLPQLPAPRPLAVPTRYGGRDGLDLLRPLAAGIGDHLAPGGRVYLLVTGWAGPARVAALLEERGLSVEIAARVRRAFQPCEYDRYQPGLFGYLDAQARERGERAYDRRASWCYLRVAFLRATRGR